MNSAEREWLPYAPFLTKIIMAIVRSVYSRQASLLEVISDSGTRVARSSAELLPVPLHGHRKKVFNTTNEESGMPSSSTIEDSMCQEAFAPALIALQQGPHAGPEKVLTALI
jgi:hypothetical protein